MSGRTAEGTAERAEGIHSLGRSVRKRIREGGRLRRNLPGGGRIHLDRRLPFLLVYRPPPGRRDPGAHRLVRPASAHLVGPSEPGLEEGVSELVRGVADETARHLDAFLLVELWTGERPEGDDEDRPVPRLHLHFPASLPAWAREIVEALEAVRLRPERGGALGLAREELEVEVRAPSAPHPTGLPLLLEDEPGSTAYHRMGIEVEPFFRSSEGRVYPRIVEVLQKTLTEALYRGVFAFAQEETSLDAPHPRALGRRTVSRASREVDARLGEVSASFDLLLQVTPLNGEEAWESFRARGCSEPPAFVYRPLPFDPERQKRALFDVPVSRVEDPLLAFLFREKQEELDREISLLRDRDTPGFLPGSLQIYGGVGTDLLELARKILRTLPPAGRREREEYGEENGTGSDGYVGAEGFARRARTEIDHYRSMASGFEAGVEIRTGLAAGLMVSGATLLVSRGLRVPRERVDALIQHEVGTHLLTHCNGKAQPFGQFATGLAGYDPLQEGLAVLAEYLVGGLSRSRMRVLAGRVLAVDSVVRGAGFVDTYRLLADEHGFPGRSAFMITLRVHRGGGMTKDASYLRGLDEVLAYLRGEGALDPLWVGKLGLPHLEVVQELMLRGILRLPMVKPRYVDAPGVPEKLEACRRKRVEDLVGECFG